MGLRLMVWARGFRIEGLGEGSGFTIEGSEFRTEGLGFRAEGSGLRVLASGLRSGFEGLGLKAEGVRFRGRAPGRPSLGAQAQSNYRTRGGQATGSPA